MGAAIRGDAVEVHRHLLERLHEDLHRVDALDAADVGILASEDLLREREHARLVGLGHAEDAQDDVQRIVERDVANEVALTVVIVIANQKGRALLYRNAGPAGHWVELKLIGTRSNRSAIGAEVTVEFGKARQRQVVSGGMGFCSQNDRRLHFGLGDQRLGRVTIRWPSGTEQGLDGLAEDRLHVITEPPK